MAVTAGVAGSRGFSTGAGSRSSSSTTLTGPGSVPRVTGAGSSAAGSGSAASQVGEAGAGATTARATDTVPRATPYARAASLVGRVMTPVAAFWIVPSGWATLISSSNGKGAGTARWSSTVRLGPYPLRKCL